jgi:hypothetical protein
VGKNDDVIVTFCHYRKKLGSFVGSSFFITFGEMRKQLTFGECEREGGFILLIDFSIKIINCFVLRIIGPLSCCGVDN